MALLNKIMKKYNELSVQTKAAFWFTGCSFLQKGISFITVPIFTRMMSTEEYGVYTLYTSWYQILLIFTSLYLFNGVYDNAMSKFSDDRDAFTSSIQGLSITVSLIVFAVYLISNRYWQNILGLSNKYIFLMFAEMIVAPALYFWSGRQRFEYQYKRLVIITLLKSIVNPILGLLFVYQSSDKAFGRVVSIVVVELAFDATIMVYQFAKGKKIFIKKYWKYGFTLAIPLIPHYLAGMILNQGDRIVIDRLVGKSAVAMYGVAYSIGMLVQIFTNAINSAITPWEYGCLKEKNIAEMQSRINFLLVFVGMLVCGLVFVGPEMVLIFGSAKYTGAIAVIPPVAASAYFIFLYSVLSFPEFYYEKTQFLAFASFGAAILNVILNFIFIKKYGFVAAGYTTLICYIIYSIGHYIVGKRILSQNIHGASMVNEQFTLIISIGVIVVCIVGNFLIPYRLVRYVMIGIIFMIFILNRERVVSVFSDMKKGK